MTRVLCVCGCGFNAVQEHHVITQQELRRVPGKNAEERRRLTRDKRNLVPVALGCHDAHHNGTRRLQLPCLPDRVFAFASWVMGPGKAYEYFTRFYRGEDPRLDALLHAHEAAA